MTAESTTITGNLFEDNPKTPFQLFELPQDDTVPAAASPEEAPAAPRQESNFPDICPLYPFL